MINVQDITDNMLLNVIQEGHEIEWNFFALKVMILRLRLKLNMSGYNEAAKQECYADLRSLFRKSSNIPSAKRDLKIIFERFSQ